MNLRKLSKADIQLWTMAKTSTRSKAPSKVTQTFIPVRPRKAVIASVSHKSTKQTRCKQPLRKTSNNKLSSVRFRTINKSTHCTTASTFRISVHGLKRYKHRYSYKCVVNPCNRQFATVRDWNRHQLFHRFYLKCVECRKRFATPSSRRDHM